jgi:lipid-A-disaccharide synthase
VKLAIVAGEHSGDIHGAQLARELRSRRPDLEVFGLGGLRMREAGVELLAETTAVSATGLIEVLGHLGTYRRWMKGMADRIRRDRPEALVLIDFPDFNFRLAERVRPFVGKLIYYIGPQVWAWRRGRVAQMKRWIDRMVVIFPFEESFYREAGIPVRFVGHPFLDELRPGGAGGRELLRELGIGPDRMPVALLPGSRWNEFSRLGPIFSRAAAEIARKRKESIFLVALAGGISEQAAEGIFLGKGFEARIVSGRSRAVLDGSRAALVASGTATLEAALLEVPMVVAYRVHPVTALLLRPFVRVEHFAMANIVAGRRVVPELLQGEVRPGRLAEEVLSMLKDPARYEEVRSGLRVVRSRLGEPGAGARAAEAVLEEIAPLV